MFKLIGMAVGVGLVLCLGIAIFGSSKTKATRTSTILEQPIVEQETVTNEISVPDIEPDQETVEQEPVAPDTPDEEIQLAESETEATEQDQTQPLPISQLEKHQYVFWKPFTTQASAYGFAQRLTQQTGVEMSVISHKFNSHSVSFYYDNENDKHRILTIIKEKTGLDLGDSI